MPNMNGGDLEAPQLKKKRSLAFNFSSRSSDKSRPGSNKRLSARASSQSLAESIVVDSASGVSNAMREVGFFIMGVYKPRHLSTRTQWLIDPRRHLAFCAVWDSVTVSALVFTSLVTPFEVSFMKPVSFDFWPPFANPTNVVLEIFVLNRVVDSIFFFDMILQFFLMYPVRVENGGSRWMDDHRLVVRHYLLGWFILDVLAVFPYEAMGGNDSGDGANNVGQIKIIKMVRLLRLLKLVRLLRATRVFKRWETSITLTMGQQALLKIMIATALLAHWFACVWALQAHLPWFETPVESWLGKFGYCDFTDEGNSTMTGVEAAASNTTSTVRSHNCQDSQQIWDIYVASLYFTVYTITSVGYGDIYPTNTAERLVAILLLLGSGLLWGLVVGTFSGVFANANPAGREFRNRMDDLNRFMSYHAIPVAIQRRARDYFLQSKHVFLSSQHNTLVQSMSPNLQGDLAMHIHKKVLSKVWFFQSVDVDEKFLVLVSLRLNQLVYAPGEEIRNGCLVIVQRGVALQGSKLYDKNMLWGEDVIILTEELRNQAVAKALTYVEIQYIEGELLLSLASRFERTAKHLRKCANRLALRRFFIKEAQKRKHDGGKLYTQAAGKLEQSRALHNLSPMGEVSQGEAATAIEQHGRGVQDAHRVVRLRTGDRELDRDELIYQRMMLQKIISHLGMSVPPPPSSRG